MRLSAALVVGLVAVATACNRPAAPLQVPAVTGVSPAATVMRATPVPANPRIGAVFLGAGDTHTCTASVLDSAGGDLILTAAHCVAGGVDATFVAGFEDHADPSAVWTVNSIYLDPRWVANQDPLADYAILRVGRDGGGTVEGDAGGGLSLSTTPTLGTVVDVTGYGMGVGGGPIGCQGRTEAGPDGFPSLPCAGLVDGTSGAPWTTGPNGSTIAGLTGGLDGGGCDENTSYSPPFDDGVVALLKRAEAGGPSDSAPTVFDDDC